MSSLDLELELCDLKRAYGVELSDSSICKPEEITETERYYNKLLPSESSSLESLLEEKEVSKVIDNKSEPVSYILTKDIKVTMDHTQKWTSHENNSNMIENHECDQCQEYYNSETDLKQHQLQQHSSYCFLCGKTFSKQIMLLAHLPLHYSDSIFKCILCSKEFHVHKYFARHLERHESILSVNKRVTNRIYICSICKKDFLKKEALAKHIRIHTRDEFKCSVCDFSCAKKITLKMHVISHEGNRKYKCSSCDYSFKQIGHLKRHMSRFNHSE